MNETIKPLSDRVLVEPEAAATSMGSIIIPETGKEKPQRGIVKEVGYGIHEVNGEPAIRPGDLVLFSKHAGSELTIDGKKHLLMRESDCFAIIKMS